MGSIAWPKCGISDLIGNGLTGAAAVNRRPSTHSILSVEMFEKARLFRSKKKLDGTIDVYWLFDDGGLTLLLPYILSTRTMYRRSRLRVFFLSNKVENIDKETRNMAELMAKFRIDCTDIIAISDVISMPAKHTRYDYESYSSGKNSVVLRKWVLNLNFQIGTLKNIRISEASDEKHYPNFKIGKLFAEMQFF